MISLIAREGYVYTNGELYSEAVYLSDLDSPDEWREISAEEAMRLQMENEMTTEEE